MLDDSYAFSVLQDINKSQDEIEQEKEEKMHDLHRYHNVMTSTDSILVKTIKIQKHLGKKGRNSIREWTSLAHRALNRYMGLHYLGESSSALRTLITPVAEEEGALESNTVRVSLLDLENIAAYMSTIHEHTLWTKALQYCIPNDSNDSCQSGISTFQEFIQNENLSRFIYK